MAADQNHVQVADYEQVLHMNGGEGEHSYAKNSFIQTKVISKAKPLIQESIAELYSNSFPECLNIADLGCSSGPTAYLPAWEVIESLHSTCRGLNIPKSPMLQVFLNDLPGNDFNSTFKFLPSFYERLKREKADEFGHCFIAAMPGSFYGRLFQPRSLHFVFSCFALHWLSQVPKGLVSESGIQLNKRNASIAKTSPPSVHKAYLEQFEDDFTIFLKSRSEELNPEGRMVLALRSDDIRYPTLWEIFGLVVNDMISEGLIEESKLESFNVPYYGPSAEETRSAIQREGSFNIHRLETHYQCWFQNSDNKGSESDKYAAAKRMANLFRSIGESLVAAHFGNAFHDEIYKRYAVKLFEYMQKGLGVSTYLLISLIKK